jgi:outer membrane protein OmpA-like peptidoglycan-associated protein
MAEVDVPNPEELNAANDRFGKRVAMMTAVYAVVLAIASLGGNNAMKEMLIAQQEASNQWALMETLAREGVGKIVTDEPGRVQQERGTSLETEIRETPRGVVVTFRHILFTFDSAQLGPVARQEIERFAVVLNHPRVLRRAVTLEGHADSIG